MTRPSLISAHQMIGNYFSKVSFDRKNWSNFENFSQSYNLDPPTLQTQIIKLAKTSKIIEGKDLQYLVLRNTCLTNAKLHSMQILSSPECTLCSYPSQNSKHRFFNCKFIQPVWEFLSNILQDTSIAHTFTLKCAIINVMNKPANHPLILLTNYTRLLIDRAHIGNTKIDPNTFLYKIMNLSDIFSKNDLKYCSIWNEIGYKCRVLLKPFNPQILPSWAGGKISPPPNKQIFVFFHFFNPSPLT